MTRLANRLHADAAFRAEFDSDPPRAVSMLGFTPQEVAAVARRDQDDFWAAVNGGAIGHCTICCVVVCVSGDD
jgi:hypothetical protein